MFKLTYDSSMSNLGNSRLRKKTYNLEGPVAYHMFAQQSCMITSDDAWQCLGGIAYLYKGK
jgi:hypothetical protein